MLTRRKLLASSPALALAAASPAAAGLPQNPVPVDVDADLIRLGSEFERLYKEWVPLWRESERTHEAWWTTIEARGLTWKDDIDAIWAVSREVGNEHAANVSNTALDKVNDIAERVRSIEPQTLAGLVVWAKVAKFEAVPLSALATVQDLTAKELEWEHECLLKFFAQVDRMAGAVAS
jgi:hypothetical protein